MKSIITICCILILVSAIGCKRKNDSLAGRNTYAVKIKLADTLGGNQATKETDSVIKIFLYDTAVSKDVYLYTKSTVKKGVAVLDFLKNETDYRIQAALKVGGVSYSGDTVFKTKKNENRDYLVNIVKDTIPLVLYAGIGDRNTLKVTVTAAGGAVANADVCVFASSALFATRNCLNANYSAPTGSNGQCAISNLEPGHYYILAQRVTDTIPGSPKLSGTDTFTIHAGEIKPVAISIQ